MRLLWTAAASALAVFVASACTTAPVGEESGSSELALEVPGLTLTSVEERWVRYVKREVLAKLPGTAADRAHTAAVVSWWALKEGAFNVQPDPFHHNLCSDGGGQRQLGPLEICNGAAWQVGIAALQMPDVTDAQVESAARSIHGDPTAVLARVARLGGLATGTPGYETVVKSTGRLRASWLARDGAIGISLNRQFVETCLSGGPSWCYGGWDEARAYASSTQRIKDVVTALQRYFSGTATAKDRASATDACANADLGDGGYCATYFDGKADQTILYTCVGRTTATRTVCKSGCERMPDGIDDRCKDSVASGAPAAVGSTRADMVARAQSWAAIDMPYCGGVPGGPDALCGGTCPERLAAPFNRPEWNRYRSDCSGFVSFVWQLDYEDGHRTWGFAPFDDEGASFSHLVDAHDLQPGDALNSTPTDHGSQHIMMFLGWVDQNAGIAHTVEEAFCPYDIIDTPRRQITFRGGSVVALSGEDRTFYAIRKNGVQ
jgi:hypothetical protein